MRAPGGPLDTFARAFPLVFEEVVVPHAAVVRAGHVDGVHPAHQDQFRLGVPGPRVGEQPSWNPQSEVRGHVQRDPLRQREHGRHELAEHVRVDIWRSKDDLPETWRAPCFGESHGWRREPMIDELFDATVSFLPDCGSGDGAEANGPGWFEPFPAHTPVRDEHRVCYWYGSRTSRFNA